MQLFPYLLFVFYLKKINSQCTSTTTPSSLTTLTQYQLGSAGQSNYGHFLVNGETTFTVENETAKEIYELSAYGISNSTTECTSSCLTEVSAYYKIEGSNVSLIMLRPSDESLYPNYTNMGLAPFYCASVSGNCGASTALYQYYSSENDDYYADIEQRSDINGSYTLAMTGSPLCYMWISDTTTSTTTTTTMSSTNETTTTSNFPNSNITTSTTSDASNTTTTSDSSNSTTTTLLPSDDLNTTTTTVSSDTNTTITDSSDNITTTLLPSDDLNITTTTVSSNLTTTIVSGDSSNTTSSEGEEDSSDENDDDKKHWWNTWKWPIISMACLIGIAIVVGIVACATFFFIGSASAVGPKTSSPPPPYASPTPPELPPQPVQSESIQPFTVGLPSTVA